MSDFRDVNEYNVILLRDHQIGTNWKVRLMLMRTREERIFYAAGLE